ncbi:hypothetical protein DFH06DRAFT_1150360 [Mycena polygramma]|nr:hypothetical protein DFH06DRAFT_1150360 [Mycena polygramma]
MSVVRSGPQKHVLSPRSWLDRPGPPWFIVENCRNVGNLWMNDQNFHENCKDYEKFQPVRNFHEKYQKIAREVFPDKGDGVRKEGICNSPGRSSKDLAESGTAAIVSARSTVALLDTDLPSHKRLRARLWALFRTRLVSFAASTAAALAWIHLVGKDFIATLSACLRELKPWRYVTVLPAVASSMSHAGAAGICFLTRDETEAPFLTDAKNPKKQTRHGKQKKKNLYEVIQFFSRDVLSMTRHEKSVILIPRSFVLPPTGTVTAGFSKAADQPITNYHTFARLPISRPGLIAALDSKVCAGLSPDVRSITVGTRTCPLWVVEYYVKIECLRQTQEDWHHALDYLTRCPAEASTVVADIRYQLSTLPWAGRPLGTGSLVCNRSHLPLFLSGLRLEPENQALLLDWTQHHFRDLKVQDRFVFVPPDLVSTLLSWAENPRVVSDPVVQLFADVGQRDLAGFFLRKRILYGFCHAPDAIAPPHLVQMVTQFLKTSQKLTLSSSVGDGLDSHQQIPMTRQIQLAMSKSCGFLAWNDLHCYIGESLDPDYNYPVIEEDYTLRTVCRLETTLLMLKLQAARIWSTEIAQSQASPSNSLAKTPTPIIASKGKAKAVETVDTTDNIKGKGRVENNKEKDDNDKNKLTNAKQQQTNDTEKRKDKGKDKEADIHQGHGAAYMPWKTAAARLRERFRTESFSPESKREFGGHAVAHPAPPRCATRDGPGAGDVERACSENGDGGTPRKES